MAGQVRQPIDIASLERYISEEVTAIKTPIDVKQFGYGQSNPTYLLTDASKRNYVLRKKPPGKLLSKTAHKVEREHRIIHALRDTDVPVPKTYCLCEDEGVIGTPFYIMEFLDGRIFEDPSFPGVSQADRMEMWHDALRTLAKLHRIDPTSVSLATFGKPSGFYDRQVATFSAISDAQSKAVDVETKEPVGKIPHIDEVLAFFKDPSNQPKDRGNPVHGDYKIDNLIYHKTEPRVIGIIDWEMSTIGHPLSDLINLLTPFLLSSYDVSTRAYPSFRVGATPGLPTQEQALKWYSEVAGWDATPDLPYGAAFGVFRNTCIFQGIAARYALRQASSAKAQENAKLMWPWAELAWNLVKQAGESKQAKAKSRL